MTTVLQERPFRSVRLEHEDGRPVVVKGFHHPGPLRALFDGARARGEFRILRELHARGLPVPEPLDLRRVPNGFELRMRAVPGARPFPAWLAEGPAHPERLLPRLARTLAALQRAGLRHLDLHPGNVLVDDRERAWLIDFHRARLEPGPVAPARAEHDLVVLAAALRERLGVRARARFLVAWCRATGRSDAPTLGPRLEHAARLRRRADVLRHLDRWLRPSSRVRAEGSELVARAAHAPATEALPGTEAERRVSWLRAARLQEHRLPVQAPRVHGPDRTELAAATPGGRLDPETASLEALADAGRALAALHDRALDLRAEDLPRAWIRHGAGVLWSPHVPLRPLDGPAAADGTREACERLLGAERRAAFRAGYFP